MKLTLLLMTICISCNRNAQSNSDKTDPVEYTYNVTNKDSLKAYVFTPCADIQSENHPAIVIFHGGGWAVGEPSWTFQDGEYFAEKGMIAVSAQYRLSDQKNITPLDAMEDACNVIIWMRKYAKELKIDPDHIVAYGLSAGAHLAASTAVFPLFDSDAGISSIPNALILYSPAISIVSDGWFKQLLLDKGDPLDFSPAEHLKEDMPPSIIVVGKDDTVTPVGESILFNQNMVKYGNVSYLNIYDGVGHLLAHNDHPANNQYVPDKEIKAKAFNEINLFLKRLGYIK